MAEKMSFSYDKEGDILDISVGLPQKALSKEISDDFQWEPLNDCGKTR